MFWTISPARINATPAHTRRVLCAVLRRPVLDRIPDPKCPVSRGISCFSTPVVVPLGLSVDGNIRATGEITVDNVNLLELLRETRESLASFRNTVLGNSPHVYRSCNHAWTNITANGETPTSGVCKWTYHTVPYHPMGRPTPPHGPYHPASWAVPPRLMGRTVFRTILS